MRGVGCGVLLPESLQLLGLTVLSCYLWLSFWVGSVVCLERAAGKRHVYDCDGMQATGGYYMWIQASLGGSRLQGGLSYAVGAFMLRSVPVAVE